MNSWISIAGLATCGDLQMQHSFALSTRHTKHKYRVSKTQDAKKKTRISWKFFSQVNKTLILIFKATADSCRWTLVYVEQIEDKRPMSVCTGNLLTAQLSTTPCYQSHPWPWWCWTSLSAAVEQHWRWQFLFNRPWATFKWLMYN